MGFNTYYDLARTVADGTNYHQQHFHRTGSPVILGQGGWADLSMGPGNPKYNAYVGVQYEFTPMRGAGNFGIYTGPDSSTGKKYLTKVRLNSPSASLVPSTFVLCDYLGFYPLIDMDSVDEQVLDNTQASLPRYTNGIGVRAMLVCTTPQAPVASTLVYLKYTNQNNESNRLVTFNVFTSNVGQINCLGANGAAAITNTCFPFIPLWGTDTGIRSIQSITVANPCAGFASLVLVMPLATFFLREQNTPCEIDLPIQRQPIPTIYNSGYLQFVYNSTVATPATSVIQGALDFIRE
jgi:hypothetical protein